MLASEKILEQIHIQTNHIAKNFLKYDFKYIEKSLLF